MGKGRRQAASRLQVPLSHRDDEEEKAKQWAALREAFLSDRQVKLAAEARLYREAEPSSRRYVHNLAFRALDPDTRPKGVRLRRQGARK